MAPEDLGGCISFMSCHDWPLQYDLNHLPYLKHFTPPAKLSSVFHGEKKKDLFKKYSLQSSILSTHITCFPKNIK